MNCKPGDIAVFVGGTSEPCRLNQGRIFEVLRRGLDVEGKVSWWVKPAGEAYSLQLGGFGSCEGECLDMYLRPIRDHGDDARDESLEWKPVPVTVPGFTKEHA